MWCTEGFLPFRHPISCALWWSATEPYYTHNSINNDSKIHGFEVQQLTGSCTETHLDGHWRGGCSVDAFMPSSAEMGEDWDFIGCIRLRLHDAICSHGTPRNFSRLWRLDEVLHLKYGVSLFRCAVGVSSHSLICVQTDGSIAALVTPLSPQSCGPSVTRVGDEHCCFNWLTRLRGSTTSRFYHVYKRRCVYFRFGGHDLGFHPSALEIRDSY